MKESLKSSFSISFLFLVSIAIIALSFTSCTTTKDGYVQKEYGYGTTAADAGAQASQAQPAQPAQNSTLKPAAPASATNPSPAAKPANTTATAAKPSTTTTTSTNATKAGTGTITQASKTISLEHLDFANVNVITITGIKNVELTVGSRIFLFKNPRVDTDETICFINVNGVDHIISKDGGDYPLSGISLNLRDARSARSLDYTQCEFFIKNS